MTRILTMFMAAATVLFLLAVPYADAQSRGGKGQGTRLRDGSCGSAQTTQTRSGKGWTTRNGSSAGQSAGTGSGLGDGTNPRPMDGSGFGFGAQRQ
jgi:hypothetical protein